jgi:hypothetical protein
MKVERRHEDGMNIHICFDIHKENVSWWTELWKFSLQQATSYYFSPNNHPVHGKVYSKFVSHWLATGWWFSPGTLVSSTNKSDRHDIIEILLKVALNTITLTQTNHFLQSCFKLSFRLGAWHPNKRHSFTSCPKHWPCIWLGFQKGCILDLIISMPQIFLGLLV